MKMVLPRIHIAQEHWAIIAKEFNYSRQTIHQSLKYFNNSEIAQKIRKRAIELLEKEVETNKRWLEE